MTPVPRRVRCGVANPACTPRSPADPGTDHGTDHPGTTTKENHA